MGYFRILVIFLSVCTSKGINQGTQEICQGETFSGQCQENEVIRIERAIYGRLKIGRCVQEDMGFLGCKEDVRPLLDESCSGKSECSFSIYELNSKKPCRELFPYLTVAYTCLQASECKSSAPLLARGQQGIISSYVARESGCGDMAHPWSIEVLPGQRVNISMTHFGQGKSSAAQKCKALGYITEVGHRNNITVCEINGEQHIYTSNGRNLKIYFITTTHREDAPQFLLHYKVFGCADLKVQQGAWYRREGNTATVGCEGQDMMWTLKCEGTQWNGVIGNCTERVGASMQQPSTFTFMGLDLQKLTLICIAVGFVILIIIAATVIIWKWRENSQNKPPSTVLLQEEQYRMNKGPLPPVPQDSSHYRSLIRQPGPQAYPQPHSQTMPRHQPQDMPSDDYSTDWRFGTAPWNKQNA